LEIPANPEPSRHEREKDLGDDDEHRDKRRERGRHRSHNDSHDRDDSPDSINSDETIELPPRFDQYGRRREEDPLAEKLESVLAGLFR
jgi:hypothetical protein